MKRTETRALVVHTTASNILSRAEDNPFKIKGVVKALPHPEGFYESSLRCAQCGKKVIE